MKRPFLSQLKRLILVPALILLGKGPFISQSKRLILVLALIWLGFAWLRPSNVLSASTFLIFLLALIVGGFWSFERMDSFLKAGGPKDPSIAGVQSRARKGDTRVYLMQDGSRYKIGISKNVEQRLATFKTGNPNVQLVTATRPVSRHMAERLERRLHDQYAAQHVAGEWFVLLDDEPDGLAQVLGEF